MKLSNNISQFIMLIIAALIITSCGKNDEIEHEQINIKVNSPDVIGINDTAQISCSVNSTVSIAELRIFENEKLLFLNTKISDRRDTKTHVFTFDFSFNYVPDSKGTKNLSVAVESGALLKPIIKSENFTFEVE